MLRVSGLIGASYTPLDQQGELKTNSVAPITAQLNL